MKKLVFVVSTPITASSFLLNHFTKLSERYDIYLIANFSKESIMNNSFGKVTLIDAPIERKVSIGNDLKGLFALCKIFKEHDFHIVHSITPKAGLLAMLASTFTGKKNRYHTFTGQVWVNYKGLKRHFFKILDKIIAACATKVMVDSPSQKDFLVKEKVVSRDNSYVLGNGSISGVDINKFNSSSELKTKNRIKLGLLNSDFVFLFLGRINKDKGILELVKAFKQLSLEKKGEQLKLLLVGPDEEAILHDINDDNIIKQGFTSSPEKYMACADVFCLPSYREGFGSVIIEAASAGVPCIASNIYGITDAIDNGVTGMLHPVKDEVAIMNCMKLMIENKELKESMGKAARTRAVQYFSQDIITDALDEFYLENSLD
ncbi:glycosyltransferase family 4 protein [Pseudoalteromonas sp. DL-6]|uniref:glycosyltransferase family 4 protein n=1 Tax=Pseudoalteromonas sp. DL-6 TaxID=1390185 RepID=UPI001040ABD7|nr:glycosyltransferase family 4 protein [Pseudoalteromonas sp. DL-6]